MNIAQYSTVHPNARIADNVEIGPYCYIAENVEIGEGTVIGPHVTVFDYVKIGRDCRVFPGAVVGAVPQDLKFRGEESWVEIGDRTTIRECATVNRGTAASGKALTKVGDDCLLMSYSHTAHDCLIGNHVILVSYVGLAGETQVDDWAIIGGASAAHQFTHIGTHAMLAGGSLISKDVPPFVLAGHRPLSYCNVNVVGLRRRGFSNDQIERIRDVYRIIYQSGLNRTDACIFAEKEVPASPEKQLILDFVRNSKRGIIKFGGDSSED